MCCYRSLYLHSKGRWTIISSFLLHSKKCWVKYNPALGKIWTNPAIGLFLDTAVGLQPRRLGKTFNPTVGWKHPTPSMRFCPIFTQHWVEFNPAYFSMHSPVWFVCWTKWRILRYYWSDHLSIKPPVKDQLNKSRKTLKHALVINWKCQNSTEWYASSNGKQVWNTHAE